MNILIFGSTGLLGTELVKTLAIEHNNLYLVNKNTDLIPVANCHVIDMDLNNYDEAKLPKHIDCIIYLAQSRNFRLVPEFTLDVFNINTIIPIKLADFARRNNISKFIYFSTGAALNSITAKNGFYADSKYAAEIFLRNYAQYFATFVIFRPYFIYGPKQGEDMLIRRLFSNIKNKKSIILNSEEGILINPIFILDAAKICSNALDIRGEYTLNLSGNQTVSLRKIAETIGELVGIKPIFEVKESVQNNLIGDNSRTSQVLLSPSITLQQGLELCVKEWLK